MVFLGLASCNNTSTLNEPEGKRLRDILGEKHSGTNVLIGGTTGSWAFDSITGLILDREFSYVTPENDFKHTRVRQDSTTWNWAAADAWLEHIKANNQVLRIHGPISPQIATWARGDQVPIDTLKNELESYMTALCQRYNNAEGIIMLDVVNETVHEGEWKKDEPGYGDWELPWYRIGQNTDSLQTPIYITSAFELATKYAPNLKLIYNQHENPDQIDSWDMIKSTVHYLREKGSRVDGLGWQAHVDDGWATEKNLIHLDNLITWCFNNDLSFHVTEATVWIDSTNTEQNLESHAYTYAQILKTILNRHKEGEVTWNTWNIDDRYAWHKDRKPTLFDTNFNAKPAYYAIQEALKEELDKK
jgi:GH35 family endo-1,4-beta-xylanase